MSLPESSWVCDEIALQQYLLICCQVSSSTLRTDTSFDNFLSGHQDARGGLIDKPGKSRDFYHTCYGLSGLSIAQHCPNNSTQILGDPR